MTPSVRGVFVTGTGTDVGKTFVSTWLVRSWKAEYWKPVQTGTMDAWDADLIRRLVPNTRIHDSRHAFSDPLSPHAAAERAGVTIRLEDFSLPETEAPLVVEGAGGVLVPLNDQDLMVDLMKRLDLPVLLVACSGLGTINHTLLSLEALRSRGLEPAGVILNGPPNPGNRTAIEKFGKVTVVAELPDLVDFEALKQITPLAWRP